MQTHRQSANPNVERKRQARLRDLAAAETLKSTKRRARDPLASVRDACEARGEKSWLREAVGETLSGTDARRAAAVEVLTAAASGKLIDATAPQYAAALARLAAWSTRFVRPPAEWRPRTHNVRRQFAALLRHLLARYDVPAWMDDAFLSFPAPRRRGGFNVGGREQGWFVHVGAGGNLRTAGDLPFALTKRAAHEIVAAPASLSVAEAFRWGQTLALGGEPRLASAVCGSRVGRGFFDAPQEAFWETALRFLAAQPMFDARQVGPVVDYLHGQKFAPEGRVVREGVVVDLGPPQPGLSMRGRTAESLLRQTTAWHAALNRRPADFARARSWLPSGVAGFERTEGERGSRRHFAARELLDSAALDAEGRAMRHCAASYAGSCASGRCAIFSLTANDGTGRQRRLTVEVSPANRQIVQGRGKLNAPAAGTDARILRAWAAAAGLTLGRWVRCGA